MYQTPAPPTITTNIENCLGLSNANDGISTLTMPFALATSFPFTSSSKDAQNNSHDSDGDGNGDGMLLWPHFPTLSNHQLNKLQRGVDVPTHQL